MPIEFRQGDVISYIEMCSVVGVNLQRGMNYQLRGVSVFLMSRRPGAPYDDQVDQEGEILIYEGHDCSRTLSTPDPKRVDQPEFNPGGSFTQNGLFAEAVRRHKVQGDAPEKIRVFDKIRGGIWVYNGLFELLDYWIDGSTGRKIFKFKLKLVHSESHFPANNSEVILEDDRIIPSWVKLAVWKRDQGKCRKCGAESSLHFDHIIPYAKGGSSKGPENIQILCARHNLEKHDKIE